MGVWVRPGDKPGTDCRLWSPHPLLTPPEHLSQPVFPNPVALCLEGATALRGGEAGALD